MENFVTFELAKKLKEKGFDVPTDSYYHIYDDVIEAQNSLEITGKDVADFFNSLNQYRCAAPTISQVLKWLRDEKGIHIDIAIWEGGWYCDVWVYEFYEEEKEYLTQIRHQSDDYESYELAAIAGIEYVMDNLI